MARSVHLWLWTTLETFKVVCQGKNLRASHYDYSKRMFSTSPVLLEFLRE